MVSRPVRRRQVAMAFLFRVSLDPLPVLSVATASALRARSISWRESRRRDWRGRARLCDPAVQLVDVRTADLGDLEVSHRRQDVAVDDRPVPIAVLRPCLGRCSALKCSHISARVGAARSAWMSPIGSSPRSMRFFSSMALAERRQLSSRSEPIVSGARDRSVLRSQNGASASGRDPATESLDLVSYSIGSQLPAP